MKNDRFFNLLSGKNLTIQESLFRIIIVVGETAAIGAVLENAIVSGLSMTLLPLLIISIFFTISAYLTFFKRKTELASVLTGIALIGMVFPDSFFSTGGIEGGTTIWFILGIFYTFMIFKGIKFWIFLIFNVLADGTVYLLGYLHPEKIHALDSVEAVYFDSFFAVIVVGLMCGIIMHYQIRLYEAERALAEKQRDELERANAAQNAFFSGMSHEIRTPMNSIVGLNELILRKEEDEEIREYAENIKNASKLLLELINDILDISQLKQNRMDIVPEEYHPQEMFRELIQVVSVRASEKKLELLVDMDEDVPSVLIGDEKRMKQIVLNILTNAVKYTNEGYIELSVEGERKADDIFQMKITVSDSGIGIRKEDLEGIYDAFRRVDLNKNVKVEGSGLGLSITKQLVDLMGGTIHIDSIYTKGSTFTVLVEQKIAVPTPIGKVNILQKNLVSNQDYYDRNFEAPEARILVVDDNAMNRMVIAQLLKDTKLNIDTAASGAECLKATGQKYYNVILMDYMMPEMNGAETFAMLKHQENSLCRDTPVILLTAGDSASAKQLVEEHGFDTYLEKPIQAEKLENEILKLLPEELVEYRKNERAYMDDDADLSRLRRKKRKLCITTDCVCELPDEIIAQNDIKVMYLYIRTPNGRFADTREIDSDNLSYFGDAELEQIHAVSVTVEEYEDFFAKALSEAENVIHISMAEHAGKSYGVAVAAAQGFDHVRVIDSGHISCGEGLIVLRAAQMARDGADVDAICNAIEHTKHLIETRFLMSSASVFYQNGYTNKFVARICENFKMHPVLRMTRSYIKIMGFYAGNLENSWKRFIRNVLWNKKHINPELVSVTYVTLSTAQLELVRQEILKRFPFSEVMIQKASFSNAVNAGPNTIGIAFYKKERTGE